MAWFGSVQGQSQHEKTSRKREHMTPDAERPDGRLLAAARQARLEEMIIQRGFITVAETAATFNVSEMTVRRDLARLQQRGVVARAHGGATSGPPAGQTTYDPDEPPFTSRRQKNREAKLRIATAAAALVAPGDALGLDVGTTALALADRLADTSGLRIFTNSLRAASALAESDHQLYVLGGQVRELERSVFGAMACAQLRQFWLDRVFIGVGGLTPEGVYDFAIEDTEVKRVYIERAREVVLLCDASKFGHRSLARVCELSEANILVTDAAPPQHLAEALKSAGVRVIVAD
jgi:DeoR family glycerol-3-phosphate regulon repressor